MKRQHPDNPDFFWCPKCQAYKAREGFGERKGKIDWWCKRCNNENAKRYQRENCLKVQEKDKMRRTKQFMRLRSANDVLVLHDRYIRERLRILGIIATPETIELKRQQIIMKRTLKEFKKWRESHGEKIYQTQAH